MPWIIVGSDHNLCRVRHVLMTSFLLVIGAMSMTWICDTITESGFGTFLYSHNIFIFFYFSYLKVFSQSLWSFLLNWICDIVHLHSDWARPRIYLFATLRYNLFSGNGSSLIICVGILTGYTDTLHRMLSNLSGKT